MKRALRNAEPVQGVCPRVMIAWSRDPAGMSRDERLAELGLLLALGLGRLSEFTEILQSAVEHRTPVEPLCANSPVNSRARGDTR